MKLFDDINYVRLDDDVSFQILRTNPKLTTNTKLVYDGENLYMESYQANPLLNTLRYKNHKVWKTGLFNNDIKNFLLGSGESAYAVGQNFPDTVISNDYDNQFETMYWCGVESINSKAYPQEFGFVAPLYIRKKLPNYFVIFKVDNDTSLNVSKFKFDDILNHCHILKSFNLKEGTPIGNYIRRYVGQKGFKYDSSIYVNFSSQKIYFYGIDKKTGVLSEKVEGFTEQMLENDNTIMKADDWITSGFERNNLIFPYIINMEFLFDDTETDEFKFGRYFGIYCNDIDIYDNIKVNSNKGCVLVPVVMSKSDNKISLDDNLVIVTPTKMASTNEDKNTSDLTTDLTYGETKTNETLAKSSVQTSGLTTYGSKTLSSNKTVSSGTKTTSINSISSLLASAGLDVNSLKTTKNKVSASGLENSGTKQSSDKFISLSDLLDNNEFNLSGKEAIVIPFYTKTYKKYITNYNEIGIKIENDDSLKLDENLYYYIKDKDDNIYTIREKGEDEESDDYDYSVFTNKDIEIFSGFERRGTSAFCERIQGYGKAFMAVRVESGFDARSTVSIYKGGYNLGAVYGNANLNAGKSQGNRFSINGTIEQQVKAIVSALSNSVIQDEIVVWQSKDVFVVMSKYTGSKYNGAFDVVVDETSHSAKRITKLNKFCGGTDIDGNLFKIYTEDIELFKNPDNKERYISADGRRNKSKLLDITPFINEYHEIDGEYSMLIADNNGINVDISNTSIVEILDDFTTKIGMLSFFPVKDFDFDTVSSSYGMSYCINKELNDFDKILEANDRIGYAFPVKINVGIDVDDQEDPDIFNVKYNINRIGSDYDNKLISRMGNILYGRFFNDNGCSLDTEYEYFLENIIPEMCSINKTTPFISKWGYTDDGKDSCENNYRLNFSKIFEDCNLSSNTFEDCDILEYTHSMPYYIIKKDQCDPICLGSHVYSNDRIERNRNEYQYVIVDDKTMLDCAYDGNGWDDIKDKWVNFFKDEIDDGFEKMFGDTSNTLFDNKRFNKKYSRFLFGNSNITSSTLFRGVKFNIVDYTDDDKKIYSGNYNGYKFSFIYIPVDDSINNDITGVSKKVYFVKNDKFKFVVGMKFFPLISKILGQLKLDDGVMFNKVYVYGGGMGLNIKEKDENE